MPKARLEAFSDGVLAILITIMVLELKVPHGADLAALRPLLPLFLTYSLSFLFLGIYWNNHHQLLHAAARIAPGTLWANHHLLFWLSLVPFATWWMGENHFTSVPTAAYGVVLLMSGVAYTILQTSIVSAHARDSQFSRALGRDGKGKLSLAAYAAAIPLAFAAPWLAHGLYVAVALLWLVPDRRLEPLAGERPDASKR